MGRDDILLRNWALTMKFELFKMTLRREFRYINCEENLRFGHKWIGFLSDYETSECLNVIFISKHLEKTIFQIDYFFTKNMHARFDSINRQKLHTLT